MKNEKVNFVQAATPEEFFAHVEKVKDEFKHEQIEKVKEEFKREQALKALNNHGPIGTNRDAYDAACEDTENSDRS